MSSNATMHDVARIAGVSARTVSNVVNDFRWVSPATRRAVLDAIAEVGYVPNLSARGLRQGRMGALSLVIPELRNPWFTEVADSVMAAAADHGLAVVLEQLAGREAETQYLRGPRSTRVDGVLFAAQTLDDGDADLLRAAQRPVVLMGEFLQDSPVDQVTVADREGAYLATEHLLSLGRRRLLVVGSQPGTSRGAAPLRLRGHTDALAAAGVPFDPELIGPAVQWSRGAGGRTVEEALARGLRFDAVFCFNDALALGALKVLRDAHLRVPEDVAVVGFDDVEEAQYAVPPLTSVAPDVREYGRVAVSWLVERLQSGYSEVPPRLHHTQVRLVVRSSTVADSEAISDAAQLTGSMDSS